MTAYAELRCRSNYSFLRGASHPDELVERAAALGYTALALTDQDGVHGVVKAHEAAKRVGLHLVHGSHVTVGTQSDPAGATAPLVLLVQDRGGWRNLCRLMTRGRRSSAKGSSVVSAADVAAHAAGLLALYVGEPDEGAASVWRDVFGERLSLAVSRHLSSEDAGRNAAMERVGRSLGVPIIAVGDVHTHDRGRQELQDVLTCIRHGTTLEDAGRLLFPNGERTLRPREALGALFRDHPEWLARSLDLAQACTFSLEELRYKFPEEHLPAGHTPMSWLRHLVGVGARARYGGEVPGDVTRTLEHELSLIDQLDFAGYFLTVWDIVRFARSRGILCQGRGSAANSAVCYVLGITPIDPVRMDLLFERFISVERGEPPDIDVDFEHERREEVIQYVYGKYGRTHAGMVCEVITYRGRSAVREVGKALGLSLDQVDRAAKALGFHWGLDDLDPMLREAGLDPTDKTVRLLCRLAQEIQGFPRHLSIHVGGFVVTHEPLEDLVPIENAAMADRTIIQWDKDDIDVVGLFKVDLLALGMLTCVQRCFDLVREHEGVELAVDTLPPEDPAVYDAICEADTVGVFQVESRAQMSMLPRLQPRSFYDLVVEVAIIRPGPIQGDMVHPYLRRRQGQERIDFPHPDVRRILGRTFGVPLFQEQVMRLAVVAGGFTPGEADQLRRAMAAWRRKGKMHELSERLVRGLVANGFTEEYAQQIFRQIEGFGEYGFPESHAASFAVIVYTSTWLRRHHPEAFLAAIINSQPMGFYAPNTLIGDARRRGTRVLPPDVQRSGWDCTLERVGRDGEGPWDGAPPLAVRLGLRVVKGLARGDAERLVAARQGSVFRGLGDLVRRARLRRDQLVRLAAAGALLSLGLGRREAIWRIQGLPDVDEGDLLAWMELPEPEAELPPMTPEEELLADYRATGLSVDLHPIALIRDTLRQRGIPTAEELGQMGEGRRLTVAGMVITRQRPGTASGVIFVTLEDETGHCQVVVWPKVYERYRREVRDHLLMEVDGRLQRDGRVLHVIAERVRPLALAPPDGIRSRDFH
ncbi:MAG: error-prone DNA polymerase [Myxococcales bacterium]